MTKLIAGLCIMFLLLSILSAIMDGAAGAAANTELDAAIDAVAGVIPVASTDGFLTSGGVLMIGAEKVSYTGVVAGVSFTGATRGIEATDAVAHASGEAVYNEDAGILNYAMGFSVLQTSVPGGVGSAVMAPIRFLTITMPKLVLWDFAFLQGDLIILRYVLMAGSVGAVIYLSVIAVNTVLGVLRRAV